MTHISLPSSPTPFEFEGRLIVRASSERDRVAGGERGYDLAVYSRAEGGYVAAIEFVTTVESEGNQSIVEIVDSAEDVQNVFFAFEPEELLPAELKSQLPAVQRQELLHRLYANFDERVQDVLDALDKDVPEPSTYDSPN